MDTIPDVMEAMHASKITKEEAEKRLTQLGASSLANAIHADIQRPS